MRWSERVFLNTFLLGLLHLVVTVLLTFFWGSTVMYEFDGADPVPGSRIAGLAVRVLTQPGFALQGLLRIEGPGYAEWAVFLGNSLLWGLAGALLLRRLLKRKADG